MIIAITGGNGSGKTWLANKLSEDLGWPVRSFATPLKEAARILFGYDDDKKEQVHPDFGKTHRQLIKELATHLRETYRNDFFARLMPVIDHCIIDDLRFMVEYDFIKSNHPDILVISVGDKVTEVQLSNVKKSPFLLMTDYNNFLELIKERYTLRREYMHVPSFIPVYASNKAEANLYMGYFSEGYITGDYSFHTPCRKVTTRITNGEWEEGFYAFIPKSITTADYIEMIRPGWKEIE